MVGLCARDAAPYQRIRDAERDHRRGVCSHPRGHGNRQYDQLRLDEPHGAAVRVSQFAAARPPVLRRNGSLSNPKPAAPMWKTAVLAFMLPVLYGITAKSPEKWYRSISPHTKRRRSTSCSQYPSRGVSSYGPSSVEILTYRNCDFNFSQSASLT